MSHRRRRLLLHRLTDGRCESRGQIKAITEDRAQRLDQASADRPQAMSRLLARVLGVGVETADMLVNEFFSRHWRDRKAVARYAGLTGSPDESGRRRRERGLARAGNARVRCGMIQLAWRFLRFQKDSALAQWFQARTADRRGSTRKTMIVALARKLLIALWRLATTRRSVGWHRLTSGIISDNIERKDNRTTNLAAHARVCR